MSPLLDEHVLWFEFECKLSGIGPAMKDKKPPAFRRPALELLEERFLLQTEDIGHKKYQPFFLYLYKLKNV